MSKLAAPLLINLFLEGRWRPQIISIGRSIGAAHASLAPILADIDGVFSAQGSVLKMQIEGIGLIAHSLKSGL